MNGVMIQIYSTEQLEQFCDKTVNILKYILQPSTFILHIIGSEKFFIYIKHLHNNIICYFLMDYHCFADWKSF